MIKRELAKDPKLANESWDRFLPKFRQRHLKTSEKTARKNEKLAEKNEARKAAGLDPIDKSKMEKKVYTPFPPPQQPRKVSRAWASLLRWNSDGFLEGRLATGIWRIFPQASSEGGEGSSTSKGKGKGITMVFSSAVGLMLLNTARRGYRQAAGGTSRGICTPEGKCSSYSRREENTEAEREDRRRSGWKETTQEQEKEDGGRRLLISVSPSCLMLSYYSRGLFLVLDRFLFEADYWVEVLLKLGS